MTSMKRNWKALFLEARTLVEDEVNRHRNSCGCQDVDDGIEKGGVVEGKCPGLQEAQDFLQKTSPITQGRSAADEKT